MIGCNVIRSPLMGAATSQPSETLVEIARNTYPRIRKIIITVLVLASAVSSFLPTLDPALGPGQVNRVRETIRLALDGALLYFFFDVFNFIQRKLGDLEASLVKTRRHYGNFSEVQKEIKADCEAQLASGQDLKLEIIVLAARYMWTDVLRDALPSWSNRYPGRKIVVDIALVDEQTLIDWNVGDTWIRYLRVVVPEIETQAKQLSNVTFNLFRYDIIPQRHGILINSKVLYIGRTQWRFKGDEFAELEVGQRPYVKFTAQDETDQEQRIGVFSGWMQRIKMRDEELRRTKRNP